MAAEPTPKDQKITVTPKGNSKGEKEVTLAEMVKEQIMMLTAGQIAEKVPGVTYVINDINSADYLHQQQAAKQ